MLDWAAQQDWMCEPHMLKKTGKTVEEHQHLTCENYCLLSEIAPDLPIVPTLQGWEPDDYKKHVDMYSSYGVDLRDNQLVGLGSFCRRANVAGVKELVCDLHGYGLKMHGFGLKKDGIVLFGDKLTSSDSMAWSLWGRLDGAKGIKLCGKDHVAKTCSSCWDWAQIWAGRVTSNV